MIKVTNLSKKFGGKQVLSNVNFEVSKGSIFALVGRNGAGKTTTLRCIVGAIRPDYGSIELFGKPISSRVKERIAVVTEERLTFRNFTAENYARFWSQLYPTWSEQIFEEFSEKYNFDLSQKVETFSIGMKTLFFLSLAISSQADLLVLDEPTQHLDPTIRFEIIDTIKSYANFEKTVLISSHEIYEIEEYATHIGIIKEGRVVYTDSIDSAKENHRIVESNVAIADGQVIGLVGSNILVKTNKDIGRFPKLNEIVVGYLTGGTKIPMTAEK